MFGYAGRVLYVNLTNRKTKVDRTSEDSCRKYIGGQGFATYLLYHTINPKIDPFGPENVLAFAVGPFTGTIVPTCHKFVVQAKSPQTNFIGVSLCSGDWGPGLKRAGYDAVVILGKAEKPIYLFIDDDAIQLIDAKDLWGKDSWETEELIREELGDEEVRVSSIGPAGENLVRFACITNDKFRQAGRTGMGAVMGSKNLKAVAVRGTKKVEVARFDELVEVCRNLIEEAGKGESLRKLRTYGTIYPINNANEKGALGIRNFQEAYSENTKQLYINDLAKRYTPKRRACWGCPIGCDYLWEIKEGPYKGTIASVEYESTYALGTNCGVYYFPAIVKATELCDRLGMDTMSCGSTLAWAMECYEKKILTKKDTDGVELTFGNYEALINIIRKIAYRKGIGGLLAEGTKRASEKVGKGSEHFAMHAKGLEFAAYDVRGMKLSALGFSTANRGGTHCIGTLGLDTVHGGKRDRFKAGPEVGKIVADANNNRTVMNLLVVCTYVCDVLVPKRNLTLLSSLYQLVTGMKMSEDELLKAGERVWNLGKVFNVREGWKKKDDYPPPRVMEDPVPSGPAKGSYVPKGEFEIMLNAYYKARGWNVNGIPTREKLASLNLEYAIKDIEEKYKDDNV